MKIKNIVAMLPNELREIYNQVFDQNFTKGYTMLEYVNKILEFNILVFDYIKTLPNLNVGPQGPQGPQGDSYGNGVPWALPTANKTFTYYITAVENKLIDDDVYFDGGLMKDSYAPSSLCDAIVGDTFIVSYNGSDTYYVYRFDNEGTYERYTYEPSQQGEDQLALSSEYLKAVRIL